MSIASAYRVNYDAIARDHISHWRATGQNPFQDAWQVKANEDATVALIERYSKPKQRMLDAGCGMGDLLLRCPNLICGGLDISEDYLEVAKERGLNVIQGRLEKMPYDAAAFDLVVCTDVLEHVLDLNRVVRELLRVLKVGGVLIVRTPDSEDLTSYMTYETYEFVHVRSFDEPSLYLLFRKVFDCEILEISKSGDIIHAVVRK